MAFARDALNKQFRYFENCNVALNKQFRYFENCNVLLNKQFRYFENCNVLLNKRRCRNKLTVERCYQWVCL